MMLNKATALTLRAGVVLGMILMVVGLAVSAMNGGDSVLYFGVLVLIASPLAGVVVTLLCLLREKDRFWAMIAGILLMITIAGVLISLIK